MSQIQTYPKLISVRQKILWNQFRLTLKKNGRSLQPTILSCTVDFVSEYLNEFFTKEEIELIEDSLKARIDVQYYVDKDVPDELYNKIIEFAPHILVISKAILTKLTEKKITSIRAE